MAGDADFVLVGGKVFTAGEGRPWARALAVRGDRLVAVGTDAQAARWAGRRTRTIDLRGRIVLPGFVDAHAHLADSAGERGWTRLDGTRNLEEAVDRLRAAAAKAVPGTWVVGVDWDEAKWPERRYLGRDDLDRVSRDHPIVAVRIDCHIGSLNTRALEAAAGLVGTRGFEVDPSGRPIGILKEDAFEGLYRRIEPPEAKIEKDLAKIVGEVHRLGVTSIHDVVDLRGWRAYQRAHLARRLRLRVYAMPRDPLLPSLVSSGLMTGLGDAWLRLGAVKVFADGSLGAYTAALRPPYLGRPNEHGILVHAQDELQGILETAHRAGFQTATHALGDEAIERVLSALEEIQAENPRSAPRHRLEHYELPDEAMLRRTRAGGFIASCQPNFVGQWSGPGDVYETRLGRERAALNNPYRRILRHRIPLCFGSDGMPYGPLYGIHWAVNGFHAEQRIRVEDAIRAYTAMGAYASFEEHSKGTLEPGRLADFVILDGDPFLEPERIERMRVRSTWIGGEEVWRMRPKS